MLVLDREALPRWLEGQKLVAAADLDRARKRRRVYGGALDTALLELGLADAETLARALAEATGLGDGQHWQDWNGARASQDAFAATRRLMDEASARRLRAQPLGERAGRVHLAVSDEADLEAVAAWVETRHARGCRFHLLPEMHLEALLARVHGSPLPPRFLRLLTALGARGQTGYADLLQPPGARAGRQIPAPPVETGPRVILPVPEPEIEFVEDLTETGFATPPGLVALGEDAPTLVGPAPDVAALIEEAAALRPGSPEVTARLAPLRLHLDDPRMGPVLAGWRARAAAGGLEARAAIAALGEVRDGEAVPDLITLLDAPDSAVGEAAQAALATITGQDFGNTRWRWQLWWRASGKKHRVEWLLDALGAPTPERRLFAAQELEAITGHYVGYHFDLGRRARQAARRRWQRWWEEIGRARFQRPRAGSRTSS
jgi:hypothetical protein